MWITQFVISIFALSLCQSGSPRDVRLPPTITSGPINGSYYRRDGSFTLECKAHGVPEVTYEWTRNGKFLNFNGGNVNRGSDGTITIDSATSQDAGFYQCFAKNQFGTALSNTSFVQMTYIDTGGTAHHVWAKSIPEGDSFCIESYPSKSNPKAKLSWQMAVDTVDPSPKSITLTKRIQMAENGYLCFAFAKTEDALGGHIYKMNELNHQLDVTTGGSYTNVTVTSVVGGPKQFAPRVGFSSQNETVVVEGQTITLSCFFYGNPEPNLAWTGPKNTLPVGRYSVESGDTRLTIRDVHPTDDGDYICTAENEIARNQHRMYIRVQAVPRFQSINNQPHDTNVTEGATLTFKCLTYAIPDATVVWLKNGEPLNLDQLPRRYRISNDHKSLTIADVCRDCPDRPESHLTDLTIIQCNASNIHGNAFGAGYVNVLVKTTAVITEEKDVVVEMLEEKEVTWDCKVTSDPSTPPKVKWFKETKDGDEPVYNETQVVYLKDGTLTIHVVPNKTQGWEKFHGKYRCDGDNGYSKESVHVTLTINDYIPPDEGEAGIGWWWLILLIVLLLLLILLVCIICICLRRNKGDIYNVDERERKNGHDPDKELLNNGFQDYQRPSDGQNLKGSRGSLESLGRMQSDDDASLMEFGDDPGKFTEDGSFVGAYASNTANRNQVRI